jgi:peptide/nickel transport system substrate-binding protein
LTETQIYEFKQSPEGIWQDFQSNNLDSYVIQPDQLIEYDKFLKSDRYKQQLEKGEGIERLDYVSRRYVHIQWNQAKPFFKSKKVRQALTMSIDRKRIIKQNLDGMGIEINGPFFRYSKAYDDSIKPWPFDPHLARTFLEEEGWYDSDGDGIIDKEIDGKRVPFRFALTYYVKNSAGKLFVNI